MDSMSEALGDGWNAPDDRLGAGLVPNPNRGQLATAVALRPNGRVSIGRKRGLA